MKINRITVDHAVSPQITPQDVLAIKEAGYTTVICNRPDSENPSSLYAQVIREAVEAEGLTFVNLPVAHPLTMEAVEAQAQALEAASGPVFAYCASGNRCSILWALSQAGVIPVDEILAATRAAGYDQTQLRPTLESLAGQKPD